jgi:ATP-dependent helicase HrpA
MSVIAALLCNCSNWFGARCSPLATCLWAQAAEGGLGQASKPMKSAENPTYSAEDSYRAEQVMQADWAWWQWYSRGKHKRKRSISADQIKQRLARSAARLQARQASVPAISVDEQLPIAAHADDIVAAIKQHQVIIVAGDTGSGKSTQLPKLCLAAGRGQRGMIGCTQPRRIAARSVAARVAEELHTELGSQVGFQVRFTEQVSAHTLIKFMTDGILLAEAQRDRFFDSYDTIIIDEAHERSLNIDFLLGLLRRVLPKRPDLRVIITSATIDTERFSAFYHDAPIINVAGRGYPVDVRYRPLPDERVDRGLYRGIADAIDELERIDPRGDILVFLPGEREIREAGQYLRKAQLRHTEIMPLYARLSGNAQMQVFRPGPQRRVVLTTNIAETSLTVPRIRFVIDSGLARISRYAHRSRIQRLPIEPVAQASANQRSGRCGRLGPGTAIRLYSEEDFLSRPEFTEPEILRTSLATVILRMLDMRLGRDVEDISDFPFIEPPPPAMISDGLQELVELRAIDARQRLTRSGRELARLPVDVRVARMLQAAHERDCLHEMLAIAAVLSIQDPRERPLEQAAKADEMQSGFVVEHSDFMTLYQLWLDYHEHKQQLGSSALRRWCETHFINFMRMREWLDLRRQLLQQVRALGWQVQPPSPQQNQAVPAKQDAAKKHVVKQDAAKQHDAIHQALLAGMLSRVGLRDELDATTANKKRKPMTTYTGARGRSFSIFPGSVLAGKSPRWIIAAEVVETSRVFARNCAVIQPQWLEQLGAHLLRTSCYDPWWDAHSGQVLAWQRATLYGLPVYEKRRARYAEFDPEHARQIFIEQALVADDLQLMARKEPKFIKQNRRLLQQLQAEEHKRRRHDVIEREQHRVQFFHQVLPDDICSTKALLNWCRAHPDDHRLYYDRAMLLRDNAELDQGELWPEQLQIGQHTWPLSYHFAPGADDDGVSMALPLTWLNQLDAARLSWLVPGLWQDKLQALINHLPKPQRRRFTPASQYARAAVEQLQAMSPSQLADWQKCDIGEFLAHALQQMTGEDTAALDWQPDLLPPHLLLRVVLLDDAGNEIDSDRDIDQLKQRHGASARRQFMDEQGGDWQLDRLAGWDFADLPETVTTSSGMTAWPALMTEILGEHTLCHLRLFDDPDDAYAAHQQGVQELLRRTLADKLKYTRKQHGFTKAMQLQAAELDGWQAMSDSINEVLLADFVEQSDSVRSRQQFDALCAHAAQHFLDERQRYLLVLKEILQRYHQLNTRLDDALWQRHTEAAGDLRSQLDDLVYAGFLGDLHWHNLRHYPRYLQAMLVRLDKLLQDPAADQRKREQLGSFWQRYLDYIAAGGEYNEAVDEYRWLLEEYRVSLFAQTLGTHGKTSAKRLQQAWRAIAEQ